MTPTTGAIWRQPPALHGDALVRLLRQQLTGRVREAYIFGSHACGRAHAHSDLDLILVCETTAPWPIRGHAFLDLADTFGPTDLLVYTPQEWQSLDTRRAALEPLVKVL